METIILVLLFFFLPVSTVMADTSEKLTPPKTGTIKVAVVVSEGANVRDIAGAWEVFQDAMPASDLSDKQSWKCRTDRAAILGGECQ
jgi:hypothetical protein